MTGSAPARRKLAILTNVLAPYRVPIFQRLSDRFEVTVLLSGEEGNRDQWRVLEQQVHGFGVKRVKGFTFPWTKRAQGTDLDTRYLHVSPRLFMALASVRPDAILSDEMGFRTLVALAYGRLVRRPVWVWWGGTRHTERGVGAAKRIFRRRLAPRIRRWFSYGVTSTEYLVSLGVDPQRVVELQNCVPEDRYREPARPAFEVGPRPVLLCVGRLVPGKGVDLLLRAAVRLQHEGMTFSILVVGDGPERQFLEETVVELGLRNVHFRAALGPSDVSAIYRSGDVLVFPTLDDVWGLVVNEALWSGLPALVSIYAGCAEELVAPGSTFDPLDPFDFGRKLRLALTGQLPSADLTRLKPLNEVSGIIIHEMNEALGEPNEDPPRP